MTSLLKNIIGGWRDDLMVKNISALAKDLVRAQDL